MNKPVHKIAHFGALEVHFEESPDGLIQYQYTDHGKLDPWHSVYVGESIASVIEGLNKAWPDVIKSAPRISYFDDSDNPEFQAAA